MNQDSVLESYAASIRSDADLISAAVRTGALDAQVPACPGWDVRTLVGHVAFVHRWATRSLLDGVAPDAGAVPTPTPDDNLAVWIVDGATDLVAAIEAADPDAETWHPWPLEQRAWVWGRRLALETAVHRWDVQSAVGMDASIDGKLAAEGIHEYLEMGLPRVLAREQMDAPGASLHVHCTDVDGEWLVWSDDGGYKMLPIHDKGDAALRGPADALLLALMGRVDRSTIDIVGDPSAADAWLDLPGW